MHIKGARLLPYSLSVMPVCQMDAKLWNNFASEHFIKSWLKDEGVYDLAVTIPYRQNRYDATTCSPARTVDSTVVVAGDAFCGSYTVFSLAEAPQ